MGFPESSVNRIPYSETLKLFSLPIVCFNSRIIIPNVKRSLYDASGDKNNNMQCYLMRPHKQGSIKINSIYWLNYHIHTTRSYPFASFTAPPFATPAAAAGRRNKIICRVSCMQQSREWYWNNKSIWWYMLLLWTVTGQVQRQGTDSWEASKDGVVQKP